MARNSRQIEQEPVADKDKEKQKLWKRVKDILRKGLTGVAVAGFVAAVAEPVVAGYEKDKGDKSGEGRNALVVEGEVETPFPGSVELGGNIESLPQTGPETEPITGSVGGGVNFRDRDGISIYTTPHDGNRTEFEIIGRISVEAGSDGLGEFAGGTWYKIEFTNANGETEEAYVFSELVELAGETAAEDVPPLVATDPAPGSTSAPETLEAGAAPPAPPSGGADAGATNEASPMPEVITGQDAFITEEAYRALYPEGTFDHLNLGTAPVVFDPTVGAYKDTTSNEYFIPGLGTDFNNDAVEGWTTIGTEMESSDFEVGVSGLKLIVLNTEELKFSLAPYMNQENINSMLARLLSAHPELAGKVIRVVSVSYNSTLFDENHVREEDYAIERFFNNVIAMGYKKDNSGNLLFSISVNPTVETGGFSDDDVGLLFSFALGIEAQGLFETNQNVAGNQVNYFRDKARALADSLISDLVPEILAYYDSTGVSVYPISTNTPSAQ